MWERVGGRAVQGRGDEAKMGVWPVGHGHVVHKRTGVLGGREERRWGPEEGGSSVS